MKKEDLSQLEALLGYCFARPELLQRAVTHSSHANEELKAPGLEAG